MDGTTFEKEMALCRQLSKENGGQCNWGKCETCGVLPLLYKLHHGQLLDDKQEIRALKEALLSVSSDPFV